MQIIIVHPHLIHGAEDMSVILLEAADTGEASQGSWQLIPMQDAKVRHAEGQLSPGARPVVKHQTVVKQMQREKHTDYNCRLQSSLITIG